MFTSCLQPLDESAIQEKKGPPKVSVLCTSSCQMFTSGTQRTNTKQKKVKLFMTLETKQGSTLFMPGIPMGLLLFNSEVPLL